MYRQFASTTTEQLNCNWREGDSKQQLLCLAPRVFSPEGVPPQCTRQGDAKDESPKAESPNCFSTHQCAINKEKKMRDWSKMQDDVNRLIVSKLRFYPHHRSFASASREWYRIAKEAHAPFQDGFPFLFLPYNYETQTCTFYDVCKSEKHELHLPELRGKFIHASSNGWIAVMDDSDFELRLINPLTGKQIHLPKPTYAIEDHEERFPQWEEGCALHPLDPFSRYDLLTKLVVSDDGKTVAAVMVSLKMVLMCRVGDDSWTILEEEDDTEFMAISRPPPDFVPYNFKPRPNWYRYSNFQDMVFFEGNLYVVGQMGEVIIVDLGGPDFKTRYVRARKPERSELYVFANSLVKCAGNLLLLYQKGERYDTGVLHKTTTFEVYKFEKDTETWCRIYEIGGNSLFVGRNGSISVSARDFVGCRPNCIYFANNYYDVQNAYQTGYQDDNGVFCLEEGSVEMFNVSHSMLRWVTPAMWLEQKI